MFTHKHYVPILKTKAGERWAIGHLALARRQELSPLFEIHEHGTLDHVSHAAQMCDELVSVWGTSPLFLDCFWLHGPTGNSTIIENTFDYARTLGLQPIPVIRTTFDSAALDAVRDVLDADERGVMIRVPSSELAAAPGAVAAVVQYLQIASDKVDFLLDYRNHPMNLPADVPNVPTVTQWRTFITASGSFPRSFANWPLNQWHPLPRHEWVAWLAGVTGGGLARRPAFGDYTIKDPGPPAGGGSPPVALKYTTATTWLVQLGRRFQAGFSGDIHPICASMVQRPEYSGPGFCDGDAIIEQVAQNLDGPGNPQHWLQWGINHHLTFVVSQLQTQFGI